MPSRNPRPEAQEFDDLARFFAVAGQLKSIPRTGWLDRGLSPCDAESVADHSWRTALLAWVTAISAPELGLDANRVLQLALVHDLAEAMMGDDPPYDREALAHLADAERAELFRRRIERPDHHQATKRDAEDRVMAQMLALLPTGARSAMTSLWEELRARETPEARFVKEADRVETYMQSREYRQVHPEIEVGSFAAEIAATLTSPPMVRLRDAITDTTES